MRSRGDRGRTGALAVAVAAVLAAAAWPATARGHAVLTWTEPPDGARLASAPTAIRLGFSEPVAASVGAVRVLNANGVRIDSGQRPERPHPNELRLALPTGLGDGSYVVAWQIVSTDGHVVRGAFLFHIGESEPADETVLTSLAARGGGASDAAAAGARWIEYVATLLAAGVMLFGAWRPLPFAPARLVAPAAGVALCALVAGMALLTADRTGLPLRAIEWGVVAGDLALDTAVQSRLIRGVALACLGLVAMRGHRRMGVMVATTTVASFGVTGHARASGPLAMLADVVHAGGAAMWLGGLGVLVIGLPIWRSQGGNEVTTGVVAVSRWATVALVAVALTGVALAWQHTGFSTTALSTAYGRLLVAKLVLVAAVVAVAGYNNRRLVPRGEAQGGPAGQASRLLRRTAALEVVGIALILALTSALVVTAPARSAATGFSGNMSMGEWQVSLTISPGVVGENSIHLLVVDEMSRPVAFEAVELRFSLGERGVGPILRTPDQLGVGHFAYSGDEFAVPGAWTVDLVARVSEYEERRASFKVPVR